MSQIVRTGEPSSGKTESGDVVNWAGSIGLIGYTNRSGVPGLSGPNRRPMMKMTDAIWQSLTPAGIVIIALAALLTVWRITARIVSEVGRVRTAKWTGEDPAKIPMTWVARGKPVTPIPVRLSGDDGLDSPTESFREVKRPRSLRDADGW